MASNRVDVRLKQKIERLVPGGKNNLGVIYRDHSCEIHSLLVSFPFVKIMKGSKSRTSLHLKGFTSRVSSLGQRNNLHPRSDQLGERS